MLDEIQIKKSKLLVTLLKSILYRDKNPDLWFDLINLQNSVARYFLEIGLDLFIDESEGYAYLNQINNDEDDNVFPKLVQKRQLSFHVSLLCVLLRKKLVELDSSGIETRLILHRDELVDLMKLFLQESTNQAKVFDRIDIYINKVIELGFMRKMNSDDKRYEVIRIIKAFVDAEWLSEFNEKLEEYRKHADELN